MTSTIYFIMKWKWVHKFQVRGMFLFVLRKIVTVTVLAHQQQWATQTKPSEKKRRLNSSHEIKKGAIKFLGILVTNQSTGKLDEEKTAYKHIC